MSATPWGRWLAPLVAGLALRCALLPVADLVAGSEPADPWLLAARDWRLGGMIQAGPDGLPAPLHPVAVAWALDSGTADLDPMPGVPLVQVAADGLALLLLAWAAARRFGRRAGAATAWLYALHPVAILGAGATISPASVTAAALALAVAALARLDDAPRGPWTAALLLGVGLGLATLADEAGATLAVAAAIGLLPWTRGPPARRLGVAALVLGVALATTTPWAEHARGTLGVALLSGTLGDHEAVLGNAPPGVPGELLWDAEPDLSARRALARSLGVRAWFEWPALAAERAGRRLRALLGPETALPARLARALDAPDARGASGRRAGPAAWRLPDGTLGRVVQLLCGLAVLSVFALGAAGLAAAPREPYGRLVLLVTAILVARGLLGAVDDGLRWLLVPLWLPLAGLALDMATQRAPLGTARSRSAAAVGLGCAALLTVTLFLLPAP